MIPQEEQSLLFDTITAAVELGSAGEVLEGYRRLDLGLAWAEIGAASGKEGGKELAGRYRSALVRYSQEFGVAWDEESEDPVLSAASPGAGCALLNEWRDDGGEPE